MKFSNEQAQEIVEFLQDNPWIWLDDDGDCRCCGAKIYFHKEVHLDNCVFLGLQT